MLVFGGFFAMLTLLNVITHHILTYAHLCGQGM